LSSRAKEKFKREREDEDNPAVQPEVEPNAGGCTALSVAKGLVTEPVLTLEIEGEECEFMVDTGAMVSLVQPGISKAQVQPCDVQARGVTGTQLDILGEQKVEFTLRNKDYFMTFEHTFVVSALIRCSSGILGMDFLQRVGAEISLTAQVLTIGRRSFPLKCRQLEVSEVRRLINAGLGESSGRDLQEGQDEPVGDWDWYRRARGDCNSTSSLCANSPVSSCR
jgi:hypothetical protein